MLIAVLSDTHGLFRPDLLPLLYGVDHILHGGDIGNPEILATLSAIAPVTAIRGNIDQYGPCADLPATEVAQFGGVMIYMLHALDDLDIHPHTAGFSVVVYGHSHKPGIEHRNGVLYLNPGSCGPRRFNLPITFALLRIDDGKPTAEIVLLQP